MWHVSSRSGEATMRTALHLLLVTHRRENVANLGAVDARLISAARSLHVAMVTTMTLDNRQLHQRSCRRVVNLPRSVNATYRRHSDTIRDATSTCAQQPT